ncbi:hypothetical protein ABK040_013881 [Willaertia magna]
MQPFNSEKISSSNGHIQRKDKNWRTEYIENLKSCINLGEKFKTLLGPKSFDKLFTSEENEIIITNDGATAIQYYINENDMTKLFIELSQSMDDLIGDGTTSVIILTSEILKESLQLFFEGIHPIQIIKSLNLINNWIEQHLIEFQVIKINPLEYNNRDFALQLVKTTLNSKCTSMVIPNLSNIIVDAMIASKGNKKLIQVIKSGYISGSITFKGSTNELTQCLKSCQLFDSNFIHENDLNLSLQKPKIAILTFDLEFTKTTELSNNNTIDSQQIDRILKEEDNYLKTIVVQLKKLGVQCLLVMENISNGVGYGISEKAKYWLYRSKIHALKPLKKSDTLLISDMFNIRPISSVNELKELTTNEKKNQYVKEIEYIKTIHISDQIYVSLGQTEEQFKDLPYSVIILSSPTFISIEEMERAYNDAIRVLEHFFKKPYLVPGGGACETSLSAFITLQLELNNLTSLDKIVLNSFCKVLESIPNILSNQSFNTLQNNTISTPTILVNELKNIYYKKLRNKELSNYDGIFIPTNNKQQITLSNICDMKEKGVLELFDSKLSQIQLALQTAQQLLKICQIIPLSK